MIAKAFLPFFFLIATLSFSQPTGLNQIFKSKTETLSLRLHPNQDIISALTSALMQNQFRALSVATAVGSVRSCWLRFANNSYLSFLDGPLEITSLVGTFDKNLEPHIHIQLADGAGKSIGGHLPSLSERKQRVFVANTKTSNSNELGCKIFTTLEIVLLHHIDLLYERKIDPETTYHQLYISRKPSQFD